MAAKLLPQIVVMDVIMPDKDGVAACREIMEANPETRVVMLTASTEEDAVVEAVAAGATGFLQGTCCCQPCEGSPQVNFTCPSTL